MAKFEKPPGPAVLYAVVREGRVIYTSEEPLKKGIPRSATVPYVPEWEREKWKDDYGSLLEAGENERAAFEDALIAVQILAGELTPATGSASRSGQRADAAIAKAKELAPGAWIVKRPE